MFDAGLKVIEVGGDEGLLDVELTGLAIEAGAVPIEDAVGGVAVLLHLDDDVAFTNGVEASAGDEDAVAALDVDGVEGLLHAAVAEEDFKLVTGDAFLEAGVDVGAGQGIGEVPHLGLGLAVRGPGAMWAGGWTWTKRRSRGVERA